MPRGVYTITKEVDVEVRIDDIPTKELLAELKGRGVNLNSDYIIETLKADGCPENILNPLVEWINQPVVNDFKLRQWKELCLVK